MLFQCFIEGKGEPFFAQGKNYQEARRMAEESLDGLGLPIRGLRMKRIVNHGKLFRCLLMEGSVTFLSHGSSIGRARMRIRCFLEHYLIPAKGLRLKRFQRQRKLHKLTNVKI